jgi:hypothetical protein
MKKRIQRREEEAIAKAARTQNSEEPYFFIINYMEIAEAQT